MERTLNRNSILFELDRELVDKYTEEELCTLIHEIYQRYTDPEEREQLLSFGSLGVLPRDEEQAQLFKLWREENLK